MRELLKGFLDNDMGWVSSCSKERFGQQSFMSKNPGLKNKKIENKKAL